MRIIDIAYVLLILIDFQDFVTVLSSVSQYPLEGYVEQVVEHIEEKKFRKYLTK